MFKSSITIIITSHNSREKIAKRKITKNIREENEAIKKQRDIASDINYFRIITIKLLLFTYTLIHVPTYLFSFIAIFIGNHSPRLETLRNKCFIGNYSAVLIKNFYQRWGVYSRAAGYWIIKVNQFYFIFYKGISLTDLGNKILTRLIKKKCTSFSGKNSKFNLEIYVPFTRKNKKTSGLALLELVFSGLLRETNFGIKKLLLSNLQTWTFWYG